MEQIERIGVVGLGYVGLTLSVVLANRDYKVIGSEENSQIRNNLKIGKTYFFENGLESFLKSTLDSGNLKITDSLNASDKCDAYILCVGSPLDKDKKPCIGNIENASKELSRCIKKDPLIILRSTVPVGVTRNKVIPILEGNDKKCGKDFSLVFAPERTLEGTAVKELYKNPQIIGGYDERSIQRAASLFKRITPTIQCMSSIESAESVKLLDNVSRDATFAFSNLFATLCEDLSLDAYEIINAANYYYDRNNIPLPSPGVGGTCLTKDPRLLFNSSKETEGIEYILKGREINETIPKRMVKRIKEKLENIGKNIEDSDFFLSGFAFKGNPETDDMRDSTSVWFLNELKKYVKNIKGYDPIVKKSVLRNLDINVVNNYKDGFKDTDCAVFLNNHKEFSEIPIIRLTEYMKKPSVIFDSWRKLDPRIKNLEGITYMGVGL